MVWLCKLFIKYSCNSILDFKYTKNRTQYIAVHVRLVNRLRSLLRGELREAILGFIEEWSITHSIVDPVAKNILGDPEPTGELLSEQVFAVELNRFHCAVDQITFYSNGHGIQIKFSINREHCLELVQVETHCPEPIPERILLQSNPCPTSDTDQPENHCDELPNGLEIHDVRNTQNEQNAWRENPPPDVGLTAPIKLLHSDHVRKWNIPNLYHHPEKSFRNNGFDLTSLHAILLPV